MRARAAACRLHPSRARRVWIDEQGTHRCENKKEVGRQNDRRAVFSNGHEMRRRVFYLGKVYPACYCTPRASHEPFRMGGSRNKFAGFLQPHKTVLVEFYMKG